MKIYELIEAGDLAGIRDVAVDMNLNRSFPDSDECPLSAAASLGDPDIVRLLLEFGADPNYRKTVTPPLAAAASSGSVETLIAIIEAGAQIDVRDEDGSTPLMDAAACGHVDIVKELLERGANPKLKDRYGNTALGYAVEKERYEVCDVLALVSTPKEREKLRIALAIDAQGGIDPRVDALILAAGKGEFDTLSEIVASGVCADAINRRGTTALMFAANGNHMTVVQWLLDQGADVNRKDIDGEWPLTYAAMGCHPEMFDFLYPLTDKKLRKRAEKIKENQIAVGNWPADST